MFTDTFYLNLPTLENFIEITNPLNFFSLPPDWYIVITDIRGSTQAIESGRYRDVNILGVSSIIAVLNRAKHLEIRLFQANGVKCSLSYILPSTRNGLSFRFFTKLT